MPQAIRTPRNTTYYVTRSTRDRQCLLPSHRKKVSAVMLYLLASVAAWLHIELHVLSITPDRWQMVLTDRDGRLPRLFEFVHPSITATLNHFFHRSGSTWQPCERLERRILETRAEVLEYSARVVSAPVRAGLVRHGGSYRGVCSRPKSLSQTRKIPRPGGTTIPRVVPVPPVATLKFVCPPQFESAEVFAAELTEAVDALEETERQRRTHFATEAQLEALDPGRGLEQLDELDHELTEIEKAEFERTDSQRRERQTRQQGRWFRKLYQPIWLKFKSGFRDAVFPLATYWMAFIGGCNIEAPPPDIEAPPPESNPVT